MNHIKKFNEMYLRGGRTTEGDKHFYTDTQTGVVLKDNNVSNLVNQFLDLDEEDKEAFLRRIDEIQMKISRKNFAELRDSNINESLQTDQISSMIIETNEWEDDEDFGITKNLVIKTKSGKTYRTKVKSDEDKWNDTNEQ